MLNLEITKFTVGQLKTNCYLITDKKTNNCLVVDPGDSGDFISEKIISNKLNLKAILLTHGHFDHMLASWEIQSNFNVPVYLGMDDNFLIKRASQTAEYFLGYKIYINSPKITLIENNEKNIIVDDFKINLIHLPGHTPGSLGYNLNSNILFSGDVLFSDGAIGRYDFEYSNKNDLDKSILKIKNNKFIKNIYPGHGEAFNN